MTSAAVRLRRLSGTVLAALLAVVVLVLAPGAASATSAAAAEAVSVAAANYDWRAHTADAHAGVAYERAPTVTTRDVAATVERTLVSRFGVAANSADDLARLPASHLKSVRSLQSRISEHQSKLDAYRADPDAFDNLGILSRAPTPEIRQSIIDGRIRHLETEIPTFQNQMDKFLGGE